MLRFLFEDVAPDEKARGMLGPDRAEQLRDVIAALEELRSGRPTRSTRP